LTKRSAAFPPPTEKFVRIIQIYRRDRGVLLYRMSRVSRSFKVRNSTYRLVATFFANVWSGASVDQLALATIGCAPFRLVVAAPVRAQQCVKWANVLNHKNAGMDERNP
jgi:hypothetical protein